MQMDHSFENPEEYNLPGEEAENVEREDDDQDLLPEGDDEDARKNYDDVELEDGNDDLNTPDSTQGVDNLE
jgi:hypothetical protein